MIDFSEVDKKIALLPKSSFFLVHCTEAFFLLSNNEEFPAKETKFDARECLNRAMSYLLNMKRPAGATHPFLFVFEELSSKLMNSEQIEPDFLQEFLFEAYDLAKLVEI